MDQNRTKELKWRYGQITVFEKDEFIGRALELYGEWAQNEINFISSFLNKDKIQRIVIAGANIGVQTIAFSKSLGDSALIDSFEIHPEIFSLLKKNVKKARLSNVNIHNSGLWDREKSVELSPLPKNKVFNFGGFSLSQKTEDLNTEKTKYEVNLITLDSLSYETCDLLFLDVEGAELPILKGGKAFIARHKPMIYAEVRNLEEGVPVYDFLRKLGYDLYLYAPLAFNAENFNKSNINIFGPNRETAICAVSKEYSLTFDSILTNHEALHQVDSYSDLVRYFSNKPYFTLKLFWSNISNSFKEEASQTKYLESKDNLHTIEFTLPRAEDIKFFRLDISDKPGLVNIARLLVVNKGLEGDRTILDLDSPTKINAFCEHKGVEFFHQNGDGLFLILSNYVHFLFSLPEELEEAHIRVKVTLKWPPSYQKFHLTQKGIITDIEKEIEKYTIPQTKLIQDFSAERIRLFREVKQFIRGLRKTVEDNQEELSQILEVQETSLENRLNILDRNQAYLGSEQLKVKNHLEKIRDGQKATKIFIKQQSDELKKQLSDELSNKLQQIGEEASRQDKQLNEIKNLLESKTSFAKTMIKMKHFLLQHIPFLAGYYENRAININARKIRQSPYFDRDFYLENNPDVLENKIDPARHYLIYGGFEGRNPSTEFDSNFYLSAYDDVRKAKVNPLLHFLLHGKEEGRIPINGGTKNKINRKLAKVLNSPDGAIEHDLENNYSIALKKDRSFELLKNYYHSEATDNDDLSSIESLAVQIEKNLEWEHFVISLSHDNYLTSIGGLQLYMQDEALFYARNKISYLHLFPDQNLPNSVSTDGKAMMTTISVDGKTLGTFAVGKVLDALEQLKVKKEISSINLHHLMSWDLKIVDQLLYDFLSTSKLVILHDFFSVCPQYNLLRNEREFCHAPTLDSNACLICSFSESRSLLFPVIRKIINEHKPRIIAPSSVTSKIWEKYYPLHKVNIVPHVELKRRNRDQIPNDLSNRKIRIAFLGHPNPRKGWILWRQLIDKYGLGKEFDCFYFGSGSNNLIETFVKINVSSDDRHSMQEVLEKHKIDVVLLWSIMPETFSYTFYESIAAGCFVLTHQNSGNIANTVGEMNNGIVFSDEEDLKELLLNNQQSLIEKIDAFRDRNPDRYDLHPNFPVHKEAMKTKSGPL